MVVYPRYETSGINMSQIRQYPMHPNMASVITYPNKATINISKQGQSLAYPNKARYIFDLLNSECYHMKYFW